MSAIAPGPAADLIDHAARIIVASKRQPHTAPYHWAAALYEAGMLVPPGTGGPVPLADATPTTAVGTAGGGQPNASDLDPLAQKGDA